MKARSRLWVALGVLLSGCGSNQLAPLEDVSAALRGVRVEVAVVDDPTLIPIISAQRGEWEASRRASCAIVEQPVAPASPGSAHVLVFRGDRLGDLVDSGSLSVLPESLVRPPSSGVSSDEDARSPSAAVPDASEADALQFADFITPYRDQVTKYGIDRMALPLGGSCLVLVFQRSAFDREENREAAKAANLALAPPKTWAELDALARFFQGRDWDGDGSPDFGVSLALGEDPEGVGNALFLARAAASGQHRDHYSLLFDSDTMDPRLTTPPFVEALEGLTALRSSGPPGVEAFGAEAAREAFQKGNVAFLIDRAERAGRWGRAGGKVIGVAALPGSPRVYEPSRETWEDVSQPNAPSYLPFGGGWLVGVSKSAAGKERAAAIDFAKYLATPETASRIRLDERSPMLAVRASQVAQGLTDPRSAPGVEVRSWTEAVRDTLVGRRVVPGLRIPESRGYLAELSAGRVAALTGKPVPESLQEVLAKWEARTKRLGVERQIWHYRRSLNSLVTLPDPPPRSGGAG